MRRELCLSTPYTHEDLRIQRQHRATVARVPGYTVTAQRQVRGGDAYLVAQITRDTGAEWGQSLTVIDHATYFNAALTSCLSHSLTPLVGYAFRARRTNAGIARAVAALDRIWAYATRRPTRVASGQDSARAGLTCAAYDLDLDLLYAYRTALSLPRDIDGLLDAEQAALLRDAGFTPDDAAVWFRDRDGFHRYGAHPQDMDTIALLRAAGWTPVALHAALGARLTHLIRNPTGDGNAGRPRALRPLRQVPPQMAVLALRAGLTPTEARDLHRAGTLDEAGLATLAALTAC